MIFNQSDRIMISRMSGQTNAALYSVAYQFAVVLVFVINSINSSFVPWTYRSIKDKKHNMIKKSNKYYYNIYCYNVDCTYFIWPLSYCYLRGK